MRVPLIGLLLALVLWPSLAGAQYFGRNKVRWESFEFEVLKTEHFDVYFYPAERVAAHTAGRLAERWYSRLRTLLAHELKGRQPLILYAGHPDFEQTNAIPGTLHESTGGVTEILKRRIVLPFAGPLSETDHVIGHELVHAFQFDMIGKGNGAMRLPLWFVEGMAEHLSLGPADAHTAMWMRDAVAGGKLPALQDLDDPRYFPYRYGHAFWTYVAGRWGDESVGRVLKASARSRGPLRALRRVLKITPQKLSRDWHESLRAAYGSEEEKPAVLGREIAAPGNENALHLAPALSPDGRRLAYLSSARAGGSLELYLADMENGRPLRRMLKKSLGLRYDSLQFIHSAGAWDPAGRLFAFAAVRRGRAVLSILDAERGVVDRERTLPSLEEVLSPTWSPDGKRVAFSAVRGGVTDLFVYDLESGRLDDFMADAYADLQPAWSPDGKTIAFVTDRFTTRLDNLHWGAYELARLDVASGAIERLPSLAGGKNINPQWGASGQALYFLSDAGGITNVYRLDPAAGALRQVTDLAVGVSGLTALSPALASAAAADRLVVSAYSRGRYHLHSVEDPKVLAGSAIDPPAAPAVPDENRPPSRVTALLDDPDRGLPEPVPLPERPYRARLSPDALSEPYLSFGSDRFGTFLAGGASLFWSDMLGNHSVVTALELKGSLKDLAGVVGYQNRKGRWIWGAGFEQQAFVSGSFSSGLADSAGGTVSVEQVVRFRQTDRRATAVFAYPFHRNERLELHGGYRNIGFSTEATTRSFALDTGRKLSEERRDLPSRPSLHLAELGAAWVHDSARFGPTGPIEGRRHRFELRPALGSLAFTNVLADFRRYVRPVAPVTLAARVVHSGRYGPDARDPRIAPLFVGYPNLVRGYDYDAFGRGSCIPGGCPRIDALVGSKLLVANVELRVPAFAFLGRGREYGPIPTEAVLFYDTGVAWTEGARPRFLGGSRAGVRSWGAALRFNLFGFAVGEIDYIRPLDLPGQTSRWRFVLSPGF